ncbi:sensor histidine kinase [Paenalkalicoccus suaedae]|uniref:histidine kinase n=1 Tax=Paenalkalicoccus suaedae TaxID=2592382 RepID=A0A859FIZ4_9BACI|nr:sensor histidine kinase [Paenalkalicoccus suaedae]QKS72336.1 sensor histidine kinase [Paenalkalicoccus suaedae]
MPNWFHLFPKNTGLSLYAWLIFCLLPFYFVLRYSTPIEITLGIMMIVLFFTIYRLSFIKRGWTVYVSVSLGLIISTGMTLYFGYVYFFLFLAFFIGNIRHFGGFISLYVINIITALTAVGFGFYLQDDMFMMQLPFIVISVIGVCLLPFTVYNRNKQEQLELELRHANERISQLMVTEERQRIARDLHDTLGQKLSLIGLKSDLAEKLVMVRPEQAKAEIGDINRTARLALMEVRELVSDMKGIRLSDELIHIREILDVADITLTVDGTSELEVPLLVENTLSMCLKEAVTNIVKHSQASACDVVIEDREDHVMMRVKDDGDGFPVARDTHSSSGITGMRERLEFINGTLEITSDGGTLVSMQVPKIVQTHRKEAL